MFKLKLLTIFILCATQAACDVGTREEDKLRVAWTVPLTGRYTDNFAQPFSDGRRVYLLGEGIIALDVSSGARSWEARPFSADPPRFSIVHEARLFTGSEDAIAIDTETGRVLWRTIVEGGGIGQARLGSDADAFYGLSRSGHVYALEAETGSIRWRQDLAHGWWGVTTRGVTVKNGVAYAVLERRHAPNGFFSQGIVVALDARTGQELWRHENGNGATSVGFNDSAVIAGGMLLLADGRGRAYMGVDQSSGRVRWRVETTPGFLGPVQSPSVSADTHDGFAHASASDVHAYAIEIETGRLRWKREIAPDASSPFYHAVCGSVLLHSAYQVLASDLETGRTVAKDAYPQDEVLSGFAVAGKRAFVVGRRSVAALDCP